jgi:hypothetical protein
VRNQIFSVTEPVTSEVLPVERLVDTMCHIETILEDMNETMELVLEEIKGLSTTMSEGIDQAKKGMEESGWVKLHIKELVDTMREAHGLFKDSGP